MPIRPAMRALYPKDWKLRSRLVRFVRAANRCEWCDALNRHPHPITGSRVVLTVAHLDHDPTHNAAGNLAALCQRCHNTYDAPMRARGRKERAGQQALDLTDSACAKKSDKVLDNTCGGADNEPHGDHP